MARPEIEQFPCLSDNFGVLVHDAASGVTIAIDAPEQQPIEDALARRGWTLTHVLVTHHHQDHVGAIPALKEKFGVEVIAPEAEKAKIPAVDRVVRDGETFSIGGVRFTGIATPGHTAGPLSYHLPDAGVAFTGDTLFALGCGRLFEGTPATMWDSLTRLMALPRETEVYCGHEYTLSNAKFAVTIDPDNSALATRAKEIAALRAAGKPTLPTTIGVELDTNPFLRAADPAIRAHLGMIGATDAEVFAEIRKRKDNF